MSDTGTTASATDEAHRLRRSLGFQGGRRGAGGAGRGGTAAVRDGARPAAPARVVADGRGGPRVALLCAAVITLLAAGWAARRDDGLDELVSVVGIGALTAFTLLHASVVGCFAVRRRGEGQRPSWWRHVLVPMLGGGGHGGGDRGGERGGAGRGGGVVTGMLVLVGQRGRTRDAGELS